MPEQNIIAIIWDFDKTLINGNMQEPIFHKYGVTPNEFWEEVNSLEKRYSEIGIKVNRDTIYLNHFLTCVQQGIFKGLNNKMLRDLGSEIKFFAGIPDFFKTIKDNIENNNNFKKYNITIEHYIVSTGLAEMIKGSTIAEFVNGIWGCEFIEEPIRSNLDIKEYRKNKSESICEAEITQIGYAIDNTSKTRAVFEINKGSNISNLIDVNSTIANESRRVPFKNMIYIADGPSDVPVFSVLKKSGGKTYAVYPEGKMNAFEQVDKLLKDNRIDSYGPAVYTEGTQTYMWLMLQAGKIAQRIYDGKEEQIRNSVSGPPRHLNE